MTLLFENQIGPLRAGRGDQDHGRQILLAGARDHRDGAAFAMPGDVDPLLVDVLALLQPGVDRERVTRIVLDCGALIASAALADAAFVVADDEITLLGERAGKLGEDRYAGHRFIPIDRPRAGDQDHGGMPDALGRRTSRCGDRRREIEAQARDHHVGVGRVPQLLLRAGCRSSGQEREQCGGTIADKGHDWRITLNAEV